MGRWRRTVLLLLSVYVLFILDLAWLQFPALHPVPNLTPFRSIVGDWRSGGREWLVNFLGNLVAFLPIGMIPALARPGRAGIRQAVLFSLSLSALIESVQYATGRRVADVDDLILNTVGGAAGCFLLQLCSPGRSHTAVGERTRPAGDIPQSPDGPS